MIIEVTYSQFEEVLLLSSFIESMGESSNSFRYFSSRPIEIIKNHLVTVLLLKDGNPVGYGHLDVEGDDVWFGIAVAYEFKGLGYGKEIIKYLTNKADYLRLPTVKLAVDSDNFAAHSLYTNFAFEEVNKKGSLLFFERKLSK